MQSTVDDKGRVLIPKELRERFHLTPGQVVEVEAIAGGVQILSREGLLKAQSESLQRLFDATREALRGTPAPPMDPLELKRMWEPRL